MGAQAGLFLAAEGETTCETKYKGQSPQMLASSACVEASYLLISPVSEPKTYTGFHFIVVSVPMHAGPRQALPFRLFLQIIKQDRAVYLAVTTLLFEVI